jgi:hypothetical protein
LGRGPKASVPLIVISASQGLGPSEADRGKQHGIIAV